MRCPGLPVLTPQGVVAGRIRVRPMVTSDTALLQELSRDPDVVRWTTYPAGLDEAGAQARIARADAVADRALFCVVELDDESAGTCGTSAGEAEGSIEIFYAVLPWARRQVSPAQPSRCWFQRLVRLVRTPCNWKRISIMSGLTGSPSGLAS